MALSRMIQKLSRCPATAALLQSTAQRRTPVLAATRSFVSATLPVLEKRHMKLPSMGDSITEGTIVEWTAQVGQAVKDGDVVAMVETDKVTVEIKAEMDGVVTQQFGDIDDTIEVGGDLYEIDTEAQASVEAADTSAAAAPEPAAVVAATPEPVKQAPPVAAAPVVANSTSQHRAPAIHFLGKEGWAQRLSGQPAVVEAVPLPPMYGRPSFSEAEMEALMMGGANMAPDVLMHSSGAKFGL